MSSNGHRPCVQESVCLCSRTWMLVIHNDFKGIKNFQRQGDDVDIRNLRRVFETQRGCLFRELHNCGREEIVQTLAQEERLIKLFHPDGDYQPLSCQPATFILFILSHGESGGVILTDHFKKDTDPAEFKFETYTTNDVWNLANMDFISASLKLLFLGPCRGKLAEFILVDGEKKKLKPTLPGWLSSKPNKNNVVILYATVESTAAHRYEAAGTWFVEAVCKELENLCENLPLLVFITRIQFSLSNRNTALGGTNCGQTSQLHYFFHKKFTICASKSFKFVREGPSTSKLEQVDCVPQKEIVSASHWTDESYDAKSGNLENLVKSYDKLFYYNWLDKKGTQLKRGKALIFYDEVHYVCALKMGISLQDLGYKTRLLDLNRIRAIITNTRMKRGFEHDGSFVLCVLAQLSENENGLQFEDEQTSFQFSKIIDEYTGTKCTQLVGKPKLFFFLDDGVKLDGEIKEKKVIVPKSNTSFNLHAGVCTFVGVRSGEKESDGDVIENLVQALRSSQLKEEGFNLQTVLSDVIAKSSNGISAKDDITYIKPQFSSTLPQLLNFPPLQSPYELEKYNIFHRFFGAAWLTSFLYAFTLLVLGFVSRTEYIFPTRLLLVNVDDTCGVSFTGSNVSGIDAFSLNASEWSKIHVKCSDDWKEKYSPDYVIIDFLSNISLDKAVQHLEKSENKRESVYRTVLFGYTRANLLKMIQFSSSLNNSKLQFDGLRSVVAKINVNRDFENIAVLELSNVFLKESIIEQILVQNWTSSIMTKLCQELSALKYTLFESIKTLSIGAQEHSVPLISVKCFGHVKSLTNFEEILKATQRNYPKIVCSSYLAWCEEMEIRQKEGSAKALVLRYYVESYLNQYPADLANREKCKIVLNKLKLHAHEHAVPYLRMYNKFNYTKLTVQTWYRKEVLSIASYLVKNIYNGSLENAENLFNFFKVPDENIFCVGLQSLVEEMRNSSNFTNFDALNIFSYFRNINYTKALSLQALEKARAPKDWAKFSPCKNVKSVAPFWIQEFMFDAKSVCDYGKNQTCTEYVIRDLDSILTDFEDRILTEKREILFVDFVLNSINESTADLWQKLEPLAQRVAPFKEKMISAMVDTFLCEIKERDDSNSSLLYPYFGRRIFIAYLPLIIQGAYLRNGTKGMPKYISNFDSIVEGRDLCEAIFVLYSEMQKNPEDLKSIEAFFLWNYVYALIEMKSNYGFIDTRISHFDDASSIEKRLHVLNGLRNYSKKGMDEYEKLFYKNNSQSWKILSDWHETHWYGAPFVIPQLVDRLSNETKKFIASAFTDFLKNMPKKITKELCFGLESVNHKLKCTTDARDELYPICGPFLNEVRRINNIGRKLSFRLVHFFEFYFDSLSLLFKRTRQ